jgi:hypothetical protein
MQLGRGRLLKKNSNINQPFVNFSGTKDMTANLFQFKAIRIIIFFWNREPSSRYFRVVELSEKSEGFIRGNSPPYFHQFNQRRRRR